MVESTEEVHWLELGLPEATWILRVRDFGPLVVGADAKGNSHFDEIDRHIDSRVTEIYRKLGIEGLEFEEK